MTAKKEPVDAAGAADGRAGGRAGRPEKDRHAPAGGPHDGPAAPWAEDWEEITQPAARRLLLAAVAAFAERGFHATTTRDIASRAGMSPAALYIHYRTKEELLYQISRVGHHRAVRILTEAAEGEGTPADRLATAVRRFVLWHADRHASARVVQYELAALEEEHYQEIVALRRRSEELLRRVLDEGVVAGEFAVPDLRGTAVAVLSLCIDVARWYSPDSRRRPEEIADLYAGLVLRMVAADSAGAAPAGGGVP